MIWNIHRFFQNEPRDWNVIVSANYTIMDEFVTEITGAGSRPNDGQVRNWEWEWDTGGEILLHHISTMNVWMSADPACTWLCPPVWTPVLHYLMNTSDNSPMCSVPWKAHQMCAVFMYVHTSAHSWLVHTPG